MLRNSDDVDDDNGKDIDDVGNDEADVLILANFYSECRWSTCLWDACHQL